MQNSSSLGEELRIWMLDLHVWQISHAPSYLPGERQQVFGTKAVIAESGSFGISRDVATLNVPRLCGSQALQVTKERSMLAVLHNHVQRA